METLEAEVRSKFQTSRRMSDASQGEVVEVPFDETVVRYNWIEEREFDIIDIELVGANKYLVEEAQQLGGEEGDEAAQAEERAEASAANEAADREVQEQEQDKNIERNTELSF